MRKFIVVALFSLVLAPTAEAASLSVSSAAVDFGTVPVTNAYCTYDFATDTPSSGCVTTTLTITNTGVETMYFESASACQTLFHNEIQTCDTRTAGWGGFAGNVHLSTCFSDWTLVPGESCTVVLIASPSRLGMVRGYFIMRDRSSEIVVRVPVRVRGT
ncbi:MAG: hypothetical protein ACJ74X_11115 [Gaiellaceae bacterium]